MENVADGKVVIETDLDSSGIEKGLSKIGGLAVKGLSVATGAITGTATALGGVSIAAIKAGSDFESQMSRVQAISGATGSEFNKLKEQAIQLGADTAFSSSQAAEGMENLAAAGFTTSEIMDAMPGLLDLAAASGEDLASSSDIAASTLRGFGLEAADAAHVADVLAANANKTNSSVADTGEAMKYVAPLARAAGLSIEETAAAIGIMANAGIQGSQAGTTLRGAISRLSKPTKQMSECMADLGISFYDSEGNMKSLAEQTRMMEEATAGMTDEQRNNVLVTLYGQEALSGMLALMNEGDGALLELTHAYETCDGSAKAAAETMQDNLAGALDQLGGSAETLGIVFYESVSESLKETAKSATDSINNITEAFRNGGLDDAIEAAGDEFANLAVEAASHAPDMADTAVDFIESFVDGIGKNKKKLVGAAVDMAKTLGGGLADLLPDELGEPVEEAIDSITESLESGGLEDAGETVVKTFDNVIKVVGELADVALPPLTKAVDFAGEHLELIAASATTAFAAFKGYKVVTEANDVLSKGASVWKTASAAVDAYNVVQMACTAQGVISNATLTTGQAVVGLLTGKISLATAAQTAWNAVMNANPIGLLVTAIGALVAGLGVYKLATDESKESQYALTDAQKKAIEKTHEEYEAYKELDNARKEAMGNVEAEYGYLSQLNDELMGLVDSNGQVKAGYEDRANFIVNQLAQAFDLEEDEVWDIIGANSTLADSIDELIEKKKAEAMLNANQEAYEEAIRKQNEALMDYTNSLSEYESAQKKYNEAKEAAKKVEEDYQLILKNSPEAASGYLMANQDILTAAEDAGEAFQESKTRLEDAEKAYVGYNATIQNYEGLSSAILSGESEKIEDAMLRIKNGFITAETGTKESLENQVKNMQSNYEAMQKAVEDGTPGVTQQMVDSAKQMVDSAKAELDKLQPQAEESTKKAGEKAKQGLASQKPAIDATSKEIADSSNEKLGSADTKGTGSKKASEYDTGVKSQKGNIDTTSKNIADSSNQKLGSADTKGTGSRKSGEYNAGVGSQKGNIDATSKGIADSSDMMLGSANTSGTGQRKGGEYNLGIASQSGAILSTSVGLSNTADSGMGSADTRRTGIGQGNQFATGVGSTSRDANAQGQEISRSANDGAGAYDGSGPGSDFGAGFVGGIASWISSAAEKAAELASSAYHAARRFLDEHSPSRKMRQVGKYFGQGFALGIEDEEKTVIRSSENISKMALESMNMDDISRRMQETLALNKNRVAKSFRLESGNSFLNQQNFEQTFRLSDQDIEKLARRIGERTGDEVADNMEGMSMKVFDREFARMVREVRP
ncbi:MAG: phage tail tape measure protein [Lachnospiraceae bacterium]|nr:phage tail tape measure protein [Lachnospiraceae bacterium]